MPNVVFRDGARDVPDHVAEILKPIETYRLTYEQAMAAANNRLLGEFIDRRTGSMLREHFRNLKG